MGDHQLTEIALVVLCALAGGLFLSRLKHPPILGYILAGVLLGPSCLAFISDRTAVSTLAELGVLMLLFSIGLEMSLRSFRVILPLAMTVMAFQLLGSLAILWGFHVVLHWSWAYTRLMASVFALSSTAVAVKMLESVQELRTKVGKIIVAILIAQDLALIPLILVLRNWDSPLDSPLLWWRVFLALSLLGVIIQVLSRRRLNLPWLSKLTEGDSELLPLASLALCFAAAAAAGLLGLSAAYGAFLAGLILGNTRHRQEL